MRATTKVHVAAKINKLHLPTTNKQYNHDTVTQVVLGLNRALKSTYNPSAPKQGMAQLPRSSSNAVKPGTISAIKFTSAANTTLIFKESCEEARKLTLASATLS